MKREDWQWMEADFSFAPTTGTATYSPTDVGLTDWGNWRRDTFRNYVTSVGNTSDILMDYIPYEQWERLPVQREPQCLLAPDRVHDHARQVVWLWPELRYRVHRHWAVLQNAVRAFGNDGHASPADALSHAHRLPRHDVYGAFKRRRKPTRWRAGLHADDEDTQQQPTPEMVSGAAKFPPVKQDYYPMKGGLDLLTPAIQLFPGKCFDAQNYEPEISGGYRRINGYERFDGHTSPTAATYSLINITLTGTIAVGDTVTCATSGATGKALGLFNPTKT